MNIRELADLLQKRSCCEQQVRDMVSDLLRSDCAEEEKDRIRRNIKVWKNELRVIDETEI